VRIGTLLQANIGIKIDTN